MRGIVASLLHCLVASEQPISIGAGDSLLFQDVPNPNSHMLTSRTHVLGLACGSFFAGFDNSRSSLSAEVPSDERQRGALPASTRSLGERTLFNHLKYYKVLQVGIHVAISLMEVCDVLLGTPGVSLDQICPRRKSSNSNISPTSCVSRRCMERTNIFRLFRCWLRDFGSLVP